MLSKRLSRTTLVLFALFLTACVVVPISVYAEDTAAKAKPADADADDDDSYAETPLDEDAEGGDKSMAVARVIFPKTSTLTSLLLPAGATADSVIAFQNKKPNHVHTVILVAAYLTPANQYNQVVQNFSVVRHARKVHHAETTSFQYSFTPDALLEPTDYNLVIGVYFHDSVTNATYFVPAFNNTVTIDEALGTDPKTILTYLTLLAIAGGVGYLVVKKSGLLAKLKSRSAGSPRNCVEVGTKGEGYDPDYISAEHHKYKAAVYESKSSSSPKRGGHSASPNKKKK